MKNFNQYQYNDLRNREFDAYAHSKYRIILDRVNDSAPLSILNAGCGAGDLSFLLVQHGHKVHGIDPSPEHIALASEHAFDPRCTFVCSTIEDFEPVELYDCVIATDVLEHIEDDKAAANKLLAMVRPGGLLIIAVPALPILFGRHDEQLGHYRRYTKSGLWRLLNESGSVNLEQLRYFGFMLIPVTLLYSKWLRKSYPVAPTGKALDGKLRKIILNPILAFERRFALPVGTSLIMMVKKD